MMSATLSVVSNRAITSSNEDKMSDGHRERTCPEAKTF
jgi:hypothetical protein